MGKLGRAMTPSPGRIQPLPVGHELGTSMPSDREAVADMRDRFEMAGTESVNLCAMVNQTGERGRGLHPESAESGARAINHRDAKLAGHRCSAGRRHRRGKAGRGQSGRPILLARDGDNVCVPSGV
jgi:hypothetical protein